MTELDDYTRITRDAYRDRDRVAAYDRQHVGGLSWARFTMWREVSIVARTIREFSEERPSVILDVPCGTGVAAPSFLEANLQVVASDISAEMMDLARERYGSCLSGLLQADVTRLPLTDGAVDGAVVLGFLHRVPEDIKRATLSELARVTRRFVIASFSVDDPVQRLKRRVIGSVKPRHAFAPAPWPLLQMLDLVRECGFEVRRVIRVAPPLSAESILVLEPTPRRSP
jgi:ubiquinone/menaquinone biosynthesis C-methylase UbiE